VREEHSEYVRGAVVVGTWSTDSRYPLVAELADEVRSRCRPDDDDEPADDAVALTTLCSMFSN